MTSRKKRRPDPAPAWKSVRVPSVMASPPCLTCGGTGRKVCRACGGSKVRAIEVDQRGTVLGG